MVKHYKELQKGLLKPHEQAKKWQLLFSKYKVTCIGSNNPEFTYWDLKITDCEGVFGVIGSAWYAAAMKKDRFHPRCN